MSGLSQINHLVVLGISLLYLFAAMIVYNYHYYSKLMYILYTSMQIKLPIDV